MKVSVVVTVLNEEKSIIPLLRSLLKQTFKPDEIVIVDGGSNDQTIEKINFFKLKHPKIRLHLIEESGNISHGRNVGIENAKNDLIALIDAGCVAEKEWLKNISSPFMDSKVGLVAGFYKMKTTSILQKAVAPFHGITFRKFDPRSYLPSARSMAFRKTTWTEVGGFSESLIRAGEDTLFNYAVVKKGVQMARRADALVIWEVPGSISETVRKFYSYAKGDAQTGIWWHPAKKFSTHNIKILTIFFRYFVFLSLFLASSINPFAFFLLIVSFVGYTSWSIWKLHDDVVDFRAMLLVPIIQVLSDFSVMLGFLAGLIVPRKSSLKI